MLLKKESGESRGQSVVVIVHLRLAGSVTARRRRLLPTGRQISKYIGGAGCTGGGGAGGDHRPLSGGHRLGDSAGRVRLSCGDRSGGNRSRHQRRQRVRRIEHHRWNELQSGSGSGGRCHDRRRRRPVLVIDSCRPHLRRMMVADTDRIQNDRRLGRHDRRKSTWSKSNAFWSEVRLWGLVFRKRNGGG